ncbi:MAG: class I tRNA ligase family protein, partial [Candidatus Roizmanbacteria bacterium]
MKTRFDPTLFEPKWRQFWQENKTYSLSETGTSLKGEKEYVLVMFPYPSGAGLHTGHTRIYTGVDILARYLRMKGKKLLFPIGWDAFGLPAENAAIKQQKNPKDLTELYIANFKRQMQDVGLSFDFDRELSTTDPQYYAITQWLFIQFFKMGLLHKKDTNVYYCPFCKTGLAQEEVQGDGTHERCGNKVEQRTMPQWVFRITKYADSLLSTLNGLEWPRGS